jgi:hypothetical protein
MEWSRDLIKQMSVKEREVEAIQTFCDSSGFFGRRVVERWEQGQLRLVEVECSRSRSQGEVLTLGPWSCRRDAYIFARRHCRPTRLRLRQKIVLPCLTPCFRVERRVFPQLSQPVDTMMRSRSSVLSL